MDKQFKHDFDHKMYTQFIRPHTPSLNYIPSIVPHGEEGETCFIKIAPFTFTCTIQGMNESPNEKSNVLLR